IRRRPERNDDRDIDLASIRSDAATLVVAVTVDRTRWIARLAGAVGERRADSRLANAGCPWKPGHARPLRLASIDCYVARNPSGWGAGLTNNPFPFQNQTSTDGELA